MLLFVVTPCLVLAVQPCKEWIPIKKKVNERHDHMKDKIYNVNLFRISTGKSSMQNPNIQSNNKFKVEVVLNNTLTIVMADTGSCD